MFPSDTDFDTKVSLETESMPADEIQPFNILFLGNWSGRKVQETESGLTNFRPIEIDRDNFDDVMRKLRVRLDLEFQDDNENILSLEFLNLDDFHPDKIFQQLPLFASLREIRRKLTKADTFNEAASEVRSWLVDENVKEIEVDTKNISQETGESTTNNLLDQILDENTEQIFDARSQTAEKSELNLLINKLVKPHLVQTDAVEQSKLLMIVDEVISDLMRKILHHPEFQALESAWRGAFFLVKRIEAGLKIYLLNFSKDEMTSDLKSVDDLTSSVLFQVVDSGVTGLYGEESWAVVCGNYTFSLNVDDIASLIRIAKIADNTNTPFISHIKPEMFGFESFGEVETSESWKVLGESNQTKLWTTLRSLPEAEYLGLTLPRFLARLPYGEKTEPAESFYFEEFSDFPPHEEYLWANPAFACASLLAQTYSEYDWDISQNLFVDIDNLPVHLYQENNETKSKPCAETIMTQNNCQQILDQGLMPLISFLNSDFIRLGTFQSISKSFSKLKGKWS